MKLKMGCASLTNSGLAAQIMPVAHTCSTHSSDPVVRTRICTHPLHLCQPRPVSAASQLGALHGRHRQHHICIHALCVI